MSVLKHLKQHQQLNKQTIWQTLKIAVAVGLIGLVLPQVSVKSLAALWERISLPWLLAGILASYAATWSMARRYWILIDRKITFRQTLGLVIIQTVMGNLITTSAGAASYVASLRGRYQIRVSMGLASLLLARFGDLLVQLLAIALSSWVLWPQLKELHRLIVLLITGAIALVAVFIFFVISHQRIAAAIKRSLGVVRPNSSNFVNRALKGLAELIEQEPRRLRTLICPFIGYSLLTLALTFISSYCMVRLFAVPVGPWPVMFMLSVVLTIMIVPIHVFGGLGVSDVTTMYLYSLFGIDQQEIAPIIVGWRIIFYMINLLLLLHLFLDSRINRNPDS